MHGIHINLRKSRRDSGFSLIATVTLMVLLTMVAIGLLSLSSITLRAANQESSVLEARSNARLALQLALGELQKTMGDDRAVSATAETVSASASQPHVLGAWESWTFDPLQTTSAPNYESEKADRFKSWLVSQTNTGQPNLSFPESAISGSSRVLVGPGSYGTSGNQIPLEAELVPIEEDNGTSGNLAWAVMAEDTKARIDLTRDLERPDDAAHQLAGLTFPERFGNEALDVNLFGSESDEGWGKLVSNQTLDAVGGASGGDTISQENFFDITTQSMGVLSDVAYGGLKKDLTTILENRLYDGRRVYSNDTSPEGVSDPHWSYLADYYNAWNDSDFQGGATGQPFNVGPENLAPPENLNSSDSSPSNLKETLRPVVAKMQIVFSMVTHPLSTLDTSGASSAYQRSDARYAGSHLRPWLVFEPIITLWNPYSVPLEFEGASIGLDKIPVAFRFAKSFNGTTADLRVQESQTGSRLNRSYWPLSTFVWNGGKQDAITNFSFNLRGGNMSSGATNDPILLQPGESKVFSAAIKEGDSWGSVMRDFSIQGGAQVGAENGSSKIKDVDFVEGYNNMGGFRVDHLARWKELRNPASLYDFEELAFSNPSRTLISQNWFMWCALRPQDSIVVMAKLSNNDANSDAEESRRQDFTMLLEMDKLNGISDSEILGSSFRVSKKEELYEPGAETIITREFPAATILQEESDTTRAGKTPFAVFTMTAKSTNDLLSPTKGWLFGNPVLPAYEQNEDEAAQAAQSYEFSFREIVSPNSFPMIETDPDNNRGYFGPGQGAQYGLTASPMFVIPTAPMVSLGQFQAANIAASIRPPFFNYPIGNSFAHPLLPYGTAVDGTFVDHSYLLNQRLWDSYYFSGITQGTGVSSEESLRRFLEDEATLTPRLVPFNNDGASTDEIVQNLSDSADVAAEEIAAYQMVKGPFNIHSTSVKAWHAFLTSTLGREVPARDGEFHEVDDNRGAFSRFLPSYSEQMDDLSLAAGSGDLGDGRERAERWLGYHEFTDDQLYSLAENIVEQIKIRCQEDKGPFLSLAEFINRRLGSTSDSHVRRGVLQTAIDVTNGENDGVLGGTTANSAGSQIGDLGGQGELFSLEDGVRIINPDSRLPNPDALEGNTAEGSPASLLQGDLLQHLGSVITVRSDTFRIRAYGNSALRNGNIAAEAWCEAVVQRVPEFVDNTQTPGTDYEDLNNVNETFGRRFKLVSFRWLSEDEV
ncbi:MAG: hypothetical protein Q7Q71_12465 [Verrucomicrobiota bacterium JB023]|nr:hypothetical protein [Verrucomicrobiota bacterium JB023]